MSQMDDTTSSAEEISFEVDDSQRPLSAIRSRASSSECLNSQKRPSPAVNAVPRLIDNERRHLGKALSSAQRDQIFWMMPEKIRKSGVSWGMLCASLQQSSIMP